MNSYIMLQDVSVVRKRPEGSPTAILTDISVTFGKGSITAVLGPSGAGKSTLLRIVNRLEEPSHGQIFFKGKSLTAHNPQELRRRIGMVFQLPGLFTGTVQENLNFGPALWGQKLEEKFLIDLLSRVDLPAELLKRPSHTLSIGQQQRVAIARALANQPDVLLMDEPTSALDPTAADHILKLILELRERLGLTIILVTHLLNHAKTVADRVLLLVAGKKIADMSSVEFFNSEDPSIREFRQGSFSTPR